MRFAPLFPVDSGGRLIGMPLVAFAAFLTWCVALSVIDLRQHRLPNTLTVAGAFGVLGYALYTTQFATAAAGAAMLAAPYLLVHLVMPRALGAGDAKLAVGLGGAAALGGSAAWVSAALLAPILTAGAAIVMIFATRRARPRGHEAGGNPSGTVPHGPAMCLATVSALVVAS
ncbi:A24 family peptidase [Nocardia callitridis]|uniref:A24 family peptidase n=1 Tax=Nocardia callitridis TaxID=648753 RepID=A0ABP9K986_9NOCA